MNVTCPECATVYRVDPVKIPAGGVRARCARCPGEFTVAEFVEVGSVYAEAVTSHDPVTGIPGVESEAPDTFADSFIGIEVADGAPATGVAGRDSWGEDREDGDSTDSAPGDAAPAFQDSFSVETPADEADLDSASEDDHQAWRRADASPYDHAGAHPVAEADAADVSGYANASNESSAAESSGESGSDEFESDDDVTDSGPAYGEGDPATPYTGDPGREYDRNGFRSGSYSPTTVTREDEGSTVSDDVPGAFESEVAAEGLAEAVTADGGDVSSGGSGSDHSFADAAAVNPEEHADAARDPEPVASTWASGGDEPGHTVTPAIPADIGSPEETRLEALPADASDPDPSVSRVHAQPESRDYTSAPSPIASESPPAESTGDARPAAEMFESMRTPEGFSEVERQIPDADAPLPPAPFGSADPHSRARRLARALVSDIVVYHPDRRERSIRSGTVRQEFREEIRKSWDEYVSHVGNQIARETPYFREALNELLAGGNELF